MATTVEELNEVTGEVDRVGESLELCVIWSSLHNVPEGVLRSGRRVRLVRSVLVQSQRIHPWGSETSPNDQKRREDRTDSFAMCCWVRSFPIL